MKRKVYTFLVVIICFLIQSTILEYVQLGIVKPNLLLILVASAGFIRGKKAGMTIGFLCGLLADVFWGGLIGFYILVYVVIGYINGMFRSWFYDEDIKIPLVLVGISELLYGIIIYVCRFMLKGDFEFMYFLSKIILPELIYTGLVTVVLYQVILRFNKKLEAEEQRSASRFV